MRDASKFSAMTNDPNRVLSADDLTRLSDGFLARPELKRMQNAVVRVGIDEVALDNEVVTSMSTAVSHRLDDWKVTDQQKSGRCWLFAALNLIRSGTRRKLGLKDFEFSQNHAMYFDKLERANYYFESIIADGRPGARRPTGRVPDGATSSTTAGSGT